MRPGTQPYAAWHRRCEEWLKAQGVLTEAEFAAKKQELLDRL